MSALTAIEVSDVGYTYEGEIEALRGVDLTVARGSVVGVVGPSGCGKSTLLSLVAGLKQTQVGSIHVDRRDDDGTALSMMFQKDTLLPWLTIRQNVELVFKFGESRRVADQAFVAELFSIVHLTGFEDSYPYQLSGGMRRRAAFLSAVASRPDILLLDEPFSSLDEPTRLAIHQDVLNIVRRYGMTVMLVTHDLAEAVSLCDEIVVLAARPGRVASRFDVPLGHERKVLTLRSQPDFLEIYAKVWDDLSRQIGASRTASEGGPE